MGRGVLPDLSALASGLVDKNSTLGPLALVHYFCQLDRKLVRINPVIHTAPCYYLWHGMGNCFLCVYKFLDSINIVVTLSMSQGTTI